MMLPWPLESSKNGRDAGIRTRDPLTPVRCASQAALHPDREETCLRPPLVLGRQRGSARYALRRDRGRDFARGRDAAGFRLAGLPRL